MSVPALALAKRPPQSETSSLEASSVIRHIAHELRQPLSTIESIAYYLSIVMPRHDARAKVQLDKLQLLVQQTNWILSDAIHYLQAAPSHPELVDWNEIITEAASEAAPYEQFDIDLCLAEDLPLVSMDPSQGHHLVRSLFSFYRQIARVDQVICIATSASSGEVRLEFSALAHDVTSQHVESLFEPFQPHLPPGSGLALASVRRISETHAGRIQSSRDAEGVLTVAAILPIASARNPHSAVLA
jgi:light-regulated signal transduction histidine kinase (bacteriophytochrome)